MNKVHALIVNTEQGRGVRQRHSIVLEFGNLLIWTKARRRRKFFDIPILLNGQELGGSFDPLGGSDL